MWGFQLWVNLPSAQKMTAPRYQDIPPERVPEVDLGPGARARVVAGTAGGAEGPVHGIATRPVYLAVRLDPRAALQYAVPSGHNAFVYVYDGEAGLGEDRTPVRSQHLEGNNI